MKSLYKNDQNIIIFFIPVVKTVVNWATSLVTPVFEKLFDRVLDPPSRENNLNTSGLLLRLKYIKNTPTIKKLTPRWKLFEKYQLFKKKMHPKRFYKIASSCDEVVEKTLLVNTFFTKPLCFFLLMIRYRS